MKTAIYIEDGTVQLVITPENEFEKAALRSFESAPIDAKVFAGSFYDCRGGWIRQNRHAGEFTSYAYGRNQEDRSLILRMKPNQSVTPDNLG